MSDPEVFKREALAALTTELANERTLLAYLRTALAFAIARGAVNSRSSPAPNARVRSS